MGVTSSKQTLENTYLNLLPTDLFCPLLSYIEDGIIILWLVEINKLEKTVYNCTRVIRYAKRYKELSDLIFMIPDILRFKVLEICEIPIVSDSYNDFMNLSNHPTLLEYAVTIPQELTTDLNLVLNNIINYFRNLISKHGSILDMKIEIQNQSPNARPLVARFVPPEPQFSYLWSFATATFDQWMEALILVKTINYLLLYMNGMLEINPMYLTLPHYNDFLTLLANSNNLHSLIFGSDVTADHVNNNNVMWFVNLPTLKNVYINSTNANVTRFTLLIFMTNSNVRKFEFNLDIIDKEPANIRRFTYKLAANISTTFSEMIAVVPYVMRNHPIHLIYPFDSTVIPTIQTFPNIRTIGLYDNFKTYQELVNFITPVLQQIDKLYIFTTKERKYYENLKTQYGNRIRIKV